MQPSIDMMVIQIVNEIVREVVLSDVEYDIEEQRYVWRAWFLDKKGRRQNTSFINGTWPINVLTGLVYDQPNMKISLKANRDLLKPFTSDKKLEYVLRQMAESIGYEIEYDNDDEVLEQLMSTPTVVIKDCVNVAFTALGLTKPEPKSLEEVVSLSGDRYMEPADTDWETYNLGYGANRVELTDHDIEDLKSGKILALPVNGEYVTLVHYKS